MREPVERPEAMRWASAFSSNADAGTAAAEACAALEAALGSGPLDLAACFFSAAHVGAAGKIAETLKRRLEPGCLVGASANGVITSGHEVESGAALTLIGARLPEVEIHPFILAREMWEEAARDPVEFQRCAPHAIGAEIVMMLADPFTLDTDDVLTAFHRGAPEVRIVGGLASAGVRPGSNALILNDWVAGEGGVALAFEGELRADVVVSQGCRPVGPPLTVSRVDGNVVLELDGQPALERAEQVLRELAGKERDHLKSGLYVGRPVRAGASGRGDYLIRNLLGADRDRGFIAVGDQLAAKEQIRLHVRDAASAREDLELLLSPQAFDTRAAAALIFTCNGRGRGLYGVPDGDISTLQSALGGAVPAAGMFCAGEIGPIGARNFVHGHTASIAIVRPAGSAAGGPDPGE